MNASLKSTPGQWVVRVAGYVSGLFLIALGVSIAVNSQMGTSPVSSLPFVISQITKLSLGSCMFAVFCVYLGIQILILRRKFPPIHFLQVLFSFVFSYFTDFAQTLVGGFSLPGYAGRMAMMAMSILVIAAGVLLYVEARLVPMPPEGVALAISEKTGKPFPTMKSVVDSAGVFTGVVLSFLFLGTLVGIREGTILAALLVGKVVALLRKPFLALLRKLYFTQPKA